MYLFWIDSDGFLEFLLNTENVKRGERVYFNFNWQKPHNYRIMASDGDNFNLKL